MVNPSFVSVLATHICQMYPRGTVIGADGPNILGVDVRAALGYPFVLAHVAQTVRAELNDQASVVGGPAVGAIPIAAALSLQTLRRWFYVRGGAKEVDPEGSIHGPLMPGDTVCLLDDILTSGHGLLRTAEQCKARGAHVLQVLVLVDTEQGGLEILRKAFGHEVSVKVLCTVSEIRGWIVDHV